MVPRVSTYNIRVHIGTLTVLTMLMSSHIYMCAVIIDKMCSYILYIYTTNPVNDVTNYTHTHNRPPKRAQCNY